jgi:diadenosine tetraphosphate (Ap4A) HIT family hydrolase
MPGFTLHKQLEADSILVRDLALSQLRLQNQKAAPWLILVPRREGMKEIHELPAADRAVLIEEIAEASDALGQLYAPDKINVAALGNMVPQLHVHVIARFTHDAAWPNPVWGRLEPSFYELSALKEVKDRLNAFWDLKESQQKSGT